MQSVIDLIHKINEHILNPIIVIIFAAAVLVFLWGIMEYVRDAGSDKGRDTGRRHMIAGVFGMFIMVSVFGIINIILNTLGVSPEDTGINEVIKQ